MMYYDTIWFEYCRLEQWCLYFLLFAFSLEVHETRLVLQFCLFLELQCQIRRYTRVLNIEVSHRFQPNMICSKVVNHWPSMALILLKNCASKQMLTMQQVRPGHFDHLNSSGWSDHAQFASWRDLAAGYFDELALAVFDALVLVEQKQCKFGRMLLPHTDWMLRTVACRPLWAPRRKSFIF